MCNAKFFLIVTSILILAIGGCATNTQTGALLGGATGAGAGAIVGGIAGGKEGALIGGSIGAIVGTVAGVEIGKYFDDKVERTRPQSVETVDYTRDQGDTLVVSGVNATPHVAGSGEEVQIRVTYDVLAAEAEQQVPVTETWIFTRNGNCLNSISLSRTRTKEDTPAHLYLP